MVGENWFLYPDNARILAHSNSVDTWMTVGTGMEPNSAKSTGGYVSYTAG